MSKDLFKYSEEQMNNAVEAVHNGQSMRGASKSYEVPYSTLSNKCKGMTPQERKMGPNTVLSATEEQEIVAWAISHAKGGFPVNRTNLQDAVECIIKDKNLMTVFKDNRPGKKWITLFLKRHPEITERHAENINKARAAVTPERIKGWFSYVTDYLIEEDAFDILDDSSRIFNADESGFQPCPKTGKILGPKGFKNLYNIAPGNEKESITVMATFSASGAIIPPMIVYPLRRIPAIVSNSLNPDWGIGRSESGWMTTGLYFEYIANIFYPWLVRNSIKMPVVLFIDGHRSHLSFEVSEFCKKVGIHHIALPPNATHIMQPADVSVFRPLKAGWRNVVNKWNKANPGKVVKRDVFGQLLEVAYGFLSTDIIKNGFKRSGLFPFDASAIDYSKCMVTREEETTGPEPEPVDEDRLKVFEGFLDSQTKIDFVLAWQRGNGWTGEKEKKKLYVIWSDLKCSASPPPAVPAVESEPQPGTSTAPFDGAVLWAGGDSFGYRGEKSPLATTSRQWTEYHQKKEAMKKEKESRKRKRTVKNQNAAKKKKD